MDRALRRIQFGGRVFQTVSPAIHCLDSARESAAFRGQHRTRCWPITSAARSTGRWRSNTTTAKPASYEWYYEEPAEKYAGERA